MDVRQQQGFVRSGGKLVHFVRAGTGPAVVMLHAAPTSAKVMWPVQQLWAPHFTTFAFDLPGFGLSEPLDPSVIATADLADAIAGAIAALGLGRVALYGRHTGAGVAVELALRHPHLCTMVLTDGFPVFPNPYSEARLAEYLIPLEPQWDGSHLTRAFFRYREQHIFWPWDRPALEHRADCDVPGLDFLYRGALELLEAGDNYRKVYASAFRHAGLKMIGEVKPPVCYGNRPGDSQHKTMKLYPETAWVREFPRDSLAAAVMERDILKRFVAPEPVPRHRSRFRLGGDAQLTDYIEIDGAQTYVTGSGLDRTAMPLLYLHDIPGASALHRDIVVALGAHRPVIAFDFAGQGETRAAPGEPLSVGRWAAQAREVLSVLGVRRAHVFAHGTAASVAVEMAMTAPDAVQSVLFQSPPVLDAGQSGWATDYAPDITPQPDGGNFLRLWHHLRDQELWWPWFEQRVANARKVAPRIEPNLLHRRARVLLKQPHSYRPSWQAVLGYPLARQIASLNVQRGLAVDPGDIFAPCAPRARALLGLGDTLYLPAEASAAADAIAQWFAARDGGAAQ